MKIASNQTSTFTPSLASSVDEAATLANKRGDVPLSGLLSEGSIGEGDDKVKEAFQDFVGQTFFGQMISSMRSTQGENAYFNGGRAEKIFQGQLDQVLSKELSDSSASQFADPMYKLFQLHRQ